jgi:antitoxin HicB
MLKELLSRKYPIELIPDNDEPGYVAIHPDLEGCMAQGETADEAVAQLNAARELWIRTRFEDGLPIPEPKDNEEYSGRVLLRMPPWLHAKAAHVAKHQGVSLNQLLVSAIAERLGAWELTGKAQNVMARLESTANTFEQTVAALSTALHRMEPIPRTFGPESGFVPLGEAATRLFIAYRSSNEIGRRLGSDLARLKSAGNVYLSSGLLAQARATGGVISDDVFSDVVQD